MVEDRVDKLLSKNSVEIKVDQSPRDEDKIVVFRTKLNTNALKKPFFEKCNLYI